MDIESTGHFVPDTAALSFTAATEGDRRRLQNSSARTLMAARAFVEGSGCLILPAMEDGAPACLLRGRMERRWPSYRPPSLARIPRNALGRRTTGQSVPGQRGMASALQELISAARAAGCCRLEARMLYPETIGQKVDSMAASCLHALESAHLRRLEGPHKGSYWVTLQEDEPLLESLSSKCRRDVRKGLREE